MQQEALMDIIKPGHVPDLGYRYVTCFYEYELAFMCIRAIHFFFGNGILLDKCGNWLLAH
jgi:hypothetical protein